MAHLKQQNFDVLLDFYVLFDQNKILRIWSVTVKHYTEICLLSMHVALHLCDIMLCPIILTEI